MKTDRRILHLCLALLLCSIQHLSGATPVHDVLPLSAVPAAATTAYTRGYIPWGNPAHAAADSTLLLQIGYENRYFSPDLSDEYISLLIPTPYFNIAASFNFFGMAAYHEMMAAITVSRRMGRVSLGIEADYFNYYDIERARYHHAFSAQVGLTVDVTRRLTLAFRAFNPTFSLIRMYDTPRRLPVSFDLGSNYRLYERLDLLLDLGYTIGIGLHWAVGAEYDIMDALVAKLGVRGSDYVIPMVGAAVRFYGFRFDLAVEADMRIGLSLMSNLRYSF